MGRSFLCAFLMLVASLALAQTPVPFVNLPLVPMTAAPGGSSFTLTVNGTGFVSGAVVNWNGSPRSTTFVSSSLLAATILASDIAAAGTAAVTVSNSGSLTSQPVIFEITTPVSAVGFARNDLSTQLNLHEGCSSTYEVAADFNGDGKLDLLQCGVNQYEVLLGNGDGTFSSLAPVALQGGLGAVVVTADINNDGRTDVIGAGGVVAVLLGKGDGTFQAVNETSHLTGDTPSSLVLGDFNGDGRLDLAVVIGNRINDNPGYVLILLGNGDGTFQNFIRYDVPGDFTLLGQAAVGDFNRDGKLDLAIGSTIGILLMSGNGDGTFQSPVVAVSGNYTVLIAADLNGDGKLDLVVPGRVFLGNGDGTFGSGLNFSPAAGFSILAADVNGDGKADLLISSVDSNDEDLLEVFLGNGDGTFQTRSTFVDSSAPASPIGIGDFNRDGRLDVVAVTGEDDSVLLQTTVVLPTVPLNFGSQDDNTTSNPQNVTLTNLASSSLTINSIQVVGTNAGDFAIEANSCGSSLPAGLSCTVNITFTPTAKGARGAVLQFTDGAPASPQTVGLSGTGIGTAPPAVSLSPNSLTFPGQAVGITSNPMVITLTNTGDLTLNVNGIVFIGANPGDFHETNNCASVPGGSQCPISVTFTPSVIGTRNATLNIVDNASNSPQSVPVSGSGIAPNPGLTLSSGSSGSATVQAGQKATYTLSIGGQGMGGTATLTCTGAPTGATCTVPGSENVDAAKASMFNVTVTTIAPASASLQHKSSRLPWFWATALIGVVFLPIGRRSRRGSAILPVLLVMFLACCGGGNGGGSGTGSGGTPSGTYNLTVTATMGSANQSQTLKLVVQ